MCKKFVEWTISSVMTVVENHRDSGGIQYIFRPQWTYWGDFSISCNTTCVRAVKNRAFSVFKVIVYGQKTLEFFFEKNFSKEFEIRRRTFSKMIINFDHLYKSLFSKNGPNFWQLLHKLSYKVLKNPLSMFIGV